jgi:hypothetical protein
MQRIEGHEKSKKTLHCIPASSYTKTLLFLPLLQKY